MATRPSLNSLFDAIVDEATIAEVKSELAPEPEDPAGSRIVG